MNGACHDRALIPRAEDLLSRFGSQANRSRSDLKALLLSGMEVRGSDDRTRVEMKLELAELATCGGRGMEPHEPLARVGIDISFGQLDAPPCFLR